MGLEDEGGREDFAVGWGVSANARFRTSERGAAMLGFVGGEGLAGAIYGLSVIPYAAGPTAAGGRLKPLTNYGTYAGYQHTWSDKCCSTMAYGYAFADGAFEMEPVLTNNAWANLLYKANDNFIFGIEYAYGQLHYANGDNGDNHRIMFVLSVQAAQKEPTPAPGAEGRFADGTVPTDTGISTFSRL
jgi:hypothetical protein